MHRKKHPSKSSHSHSSHSHSQSHSHSHAWGPWSDWKYSVERGEYYAERHDGHGNVDYTWENSTQTASNDQSVPRTEPSIDQLAGGFSNLNVNSGAYSHDQGIAYSSQDALPIDNSASGLPASPLYTHDTQHYHHRDKGKAVASAASHDHHYGEGHSHTSTVSSSDPYNTHGYPEHQLEGTASSFSGIGSGHASNDSYPEPSDHGEDDYELHQALKLSREELYGGSRSGGPSGSSAHYHTGYINPDTYAPNPDDFPEGETTPRGTPAPRGRPSHSGSSGVPPNFTISGTPGDAEQFDQRFVVEHSQRFQPGEVFKILWSEPKGQVAGDESISDLKDIGGPTSPFYVGYRRFIIVSTDESHHSTCVPILTYDRRGCSKRGVKANKHGIIYATGHRPRLLKNEPPLGYEPVALDIYAEGETLARESRVNYSKLVTIEHNVKVFFIGRIAQNDFDTVAYAVNKCWEDKFHRSKKSRK